MGGNDLFSNQELKKMIVPLFLEQLLVMFVGRIRKPYKNQQKIG